MISEAHGQHGANGHVYIVALLRTVRRLAFSLDPFALLEILATVDGPF